MKLTQKAIDAIDTGAVRPHLQIALKCDSEMTIRRYIRDNRENGLLTTAGALAVIREKTGLEDSEILISVPDDKGVEA